MRILKLTKEEPNSNGDPKVEFIIKSLARVLKYVYPFDPKCGIPLSKYKEAMNDNKGCTR